MEPQPSSLSGSELGSLVRSVRRLTIAVWCLTVLLITSYAMTWVPCS
jgi:hypothetical protein